MQQKREMLLGLVGHVAESTNVGVEKGNVKEEEEQQYMRENCPGVAYCQALHAWMNLKFTWKGRENQLKGVWVCRQWYERMVS